MSQVIRSPKVYDACIVGSGAGGGMAAKILTEGGLNVALLEAGPPLNPEKDFKMMTWPYELAAPWRWSWRQRARKTSANSWRPTARGRLRESRTRPRPDRIFSGFVRASSVGARTTGAASRCDFPRSISNRYTRDGLGDGLADRLRRYCSVLRQS